MFRQRVHSEIVHFSKIVGVQPRTVYKSALVASTLVTFTGIALGFSIYPWLGGLIVFGAAGIYASARALTGNVLSSRRPNNNPRRITDAQVFALLDSRRPSITASRLAAATNSTESAAHLKLRDLAAGGTLVVHSESSTTELAFRKTPVELITE